MWAVSSQKKHDERGCSTVLLNVHTYNTYMPRTKIAVLGETSTHNMCTKIACSGPFDFLIWIPSIYVDVRRRAWGGGESWGQTQLKKNRNESKGANTWEDS